MGFEFLDVMFRGICVGVAASITVGPVAVLCIQRTLSKSRRSGIVSGLGVACADTFMAMAALFFYSMLQTQIEQYNTLLRVIGGIFVVIVGVYIFAQNPVPQIRRNPVVVTREMFGTGVFLILTGLFKKAIISDYISLNFVDRIFDEPLLYSGFECLAGIYGYALQIYCDFSGYSDMAIGIALLLG